MLDTYSRFVGLLGCLGRMSRVIFLRGWPGSAGRRNPLRIFDVRQCLLVGSTHLDRAIRAVPSSKLISCRCCDFGRDTVLLKDTLVHMLENVVFMYLLVRLRCSGAIGSAPVVGKVFTSGGGGLR